MRAWLGMLLLASIFGCGRHKQLRQESIEAELRTRERENRELQENLDRTRNHAQALEGAMQNHTVPASGIVQSPRSTGIVMKDIAIGIGTMGLDEDGIPGAEGFQIVVVPRDDDGHPLKIPGTAKIFASQVNETNTKSGLGAWQIDGLGLRKSWKSGLFSTGYYVTAAWQVPPATARVLLIVQFQTLDGRVFEADKNDFHFACLPLEIGFKTASRLIPIRENG